MRYVAPILAWFAARLRACCEIEQRGPSACSVQHSGVQPRLLCLLFLFACSNAPPSTHATSRDFATHEQKVAFLERYVTFRRHYLELEYGVFYQDNSGCPPGPSDWDLTIIARVPPSELDAWVAGMQRSSARPPELAQLASELDTGGVNEWYESLGKYLGLDRQRAIVMYRAVSR